MSRQEEENPKESEGEILLQNIVTVGELNNKENCLYKCEEVFIHYNSKGRD